MPGLLQPDGPRDHHHDAAGDTALMLAAELGDVACLQNLLAAATIEATTANRIAPEGGWVHIVSREGAGVRSAGAFDDHVGGLDGGHSQDAGLQAQLVDSLG